MKFTDAPFSIDKKYATELRNKLRVFREATGVQQRIDLVFVTSHGIVRNAYADELVDHVVTMSELLDTSSFSGGQKAG